MGLNDIAIKGKPIVVCRMGRTPEIIHGEGARIVQSPVECFSRAAADRTELVVIVFRDGISRFGARSWNCAGALKRIP